MPYRPSQTIDSVGERSGTTAMPSKHDRRHSRWRLAPKGRACPATPTVLRYEVFGPDLWAAQTSPDSQGWHHRL